MLRSFEFRSLATLLIASALLTIGAFTAAMLAPVEPEVSPIQRHACSALDETHVPAGIYELDNEGSSPAINLRKTTSLVGDDETPRPGSSFGTPGMQFAVPHLSRHTSLTLFAQNVRLQV